MTTVDHLEFLDILTRYYLALDSFESVETIQGFFADGAVWEIYGPGASAPEMRIDSAEVLAKVAAAQGTLARAARLRHHLTGLTTTVTSETKARSLVKVLVTAQPDADRPPMIKETAIITCDWARSGEGWKISVWRIDRDAK